MSHAPRRAGPVAAAADFRRPHRLIAVFTASLALHAAVLAALGMIFLPADFRERVFTVLISREEAPAEAAFEIVAAPEPVEDRRAEAEPDPAAGPLAVLAGPTTPLPELALQPAGDLSGPADRPAEATSGRGGDAKRALLARFGGTDESEAAVNSGLKWLASVRRPRGGWSFHEIGGAPDPGTVHAGTEMGATACALLAFLGAGHTHDKDGPYRDVVQGGVDFLLEGGKASRGDYRGSIPARSHAGMYIQGLAAIALSESYAMTKDPRLKRPVERAARFIASAQDPARGGWRYLPRRESDTSVVGWQLMALKSAQDAGVATPGKVYADLGRFLDSVAADGGARYGYTEPQVDRPSTTAIGLLCRMYLGWDRDTPALKAGVEHLAETGPDFNDLYYGYYATQVLHHWGGEEWRTWNVAMRDGLVVRQLKEGDHAGSWNPGGSYASRSGGRLFETCLAVMTLEVYYRHLPLYDRETLKLEF